MSIGDYFLFVYGTLVGNGNPAANHLAAYGKMIGRAEMPGSLYDIGEYPGAIHDFRDTNSVSGCVFAVPADESFWKVLDEYEGVGDPEPEFIKKALPVIMDGKSLMCWVYLYNRPTDGLTRIVSGDYRYR